MKEALESLDALVQRLIEADQTASGIEPLEVARELGRVRQLITESPAVLPRSSGGEPHWRCESCGTITHATTMPAACPGCGHRKLFRADIQPDASSGPG